ncbi:GNAT family N-acetyltransferase [Deinococcus marmoris]|uniref:N-acetyltransferase domain-containing protein n=1 Tax=Deinococcus marmoris TaxID=249408 RepID=A0A1U7NY49_9DEIO|nr:GNAT family N-acetyltransferase [Deinococcus marmoris]OLV17846.1 hypothetical protein BOO71_0007597 [Deinococcus marmoris]
MAEIRKNEDQGRYEVVVDGQVAGFAEYRLVGDAVMLPHTEIDPQYEGQGLGGQVARFALDDVRQMGRLAIPMCPFIASYIRHHPQYVDLVHPQQRGAFHL